MRGGVCVDALGLGRLEGANAGPVALRDALTAILQGTGFALDYSEAAHPPLLTDARATGSPLELVAHYSSQLTWTVVVNRVIVSAVGEPATTDAVSVSPHNGMQGSPIYSTSGLQFDTLFRPELIPGKLVKLQQGLRQ